jgi:hypothetical protein
LDGRQRVGRLRPRSLDWVVGEARPRWGRRAEIPPVPAETKSVNEWLSSFWSPSLRVLEVCDATPKLAEEARVHRALEYYCLAPPKLCIEFEEVGRLGGICLHGEPPALARCRLRFDFIAWLRDETSLSALFDDADRLLAPNGLLTLTTKKRLDARLGVRWHLADAVLLSDGTTGIAARRRSRAKAA